MRGLRVVVVGGGGGMCAYKCPNWTVPTAKCLDSLNILHAQRRGSFHFLAAAEQQGFGNRLQRDRERQTDRQTETDTPRE